MRSIFRRLFGPASNPPELSGRTRASASSTLPALPEPIPVPEVVEGNGGESDWNLWKDSVLTLESEFQQLAPTPRDHEKTQPLSAEELKAYVKSRSGDAS